MVTRPLTDRQLTDRQLTDKNSPTKKKKKKKRKKEITDKPVDRQRLVIDTTTHRQKSPIHSNIFYSSRDKNRIVII